MDDNRAARIERGQRIGDVSVDLIFLMKPVNEYQVEECGVLLKKLVRGAKVINTFGIRGRRIDADLSLAINMRKVSRDRVDSDLKIAGVVPTRYEKIENVCSQHMAYSTTRDWTAIADRYQ